jgi:hypothetical protein
MQITIFHTAPDNPFTENYIDRDTGQLYEADPCDLCPDCTTPAIDIETRNDRALCLHHDEGCPFAYVFTAEQYEFETV